MQYHNYRRLIEKYSTNFEAVTVVTEGYWNDMGVWVDGKKISTPLRGAIIGIKESRILRSEGTLTEKDKDLYVLEPIDDKLYGAIVIHQDIVYKLTSCAENAEFTGVYHYTLKYESAFKDFDLDYGLTKAKENLEKRLDGEDI